MPIPRSAPSAPPVLRELGDGLILRRATQADAEALTTFNSKVHSDAGPDKPDAKVAAWTRDLFAHPPPGFKVGDFTIVEDVVKGEIVSSLNMISQTWSYGGIPFGVGRPELVGTLPGYRNRGLVRAQFEVIHQWGAERGHLVQAITGIPHYYRQFGYEMGLSLGGGRAGYQVHVPKLPGGEEEPYRVRPATEADVPFMRQVYAQAIERYLVACVWDEEVWRYELFGKSEQNVNRRAFRLIETPSGESVGFLAHAPWLWGPTIAVFGYELKPGVSWLAVTPSVVRYLQATGEAYAQRDGGDSFGAFGFWLGSEHPAYQAIESRLPRLSKPYAWAVRVADLPAFLRQVTPALERRLAESIAVGHTGELRITFYRDGLKLNFENGRIAGVEGWKPTPSGHSGDVAFPDLTFLQLLFGYRRLSELEYAFADCWVGGDEPRALLNALFPRQVSDIWMLS